MKVSIITIAYNSEATLERTIQSVFNQSYKDIEYIIVDGASKDGTLDIVKKYEPLFEGRMKWKSEPDKGIYDAMNKGIRLATGDIIGIVNSDDWLELDAIENIVKKAETIKDYQSCIFCGSLRFHYSDGSSQIMETDERRFNTGMSKGSLNHGAYHPSMFVGRNVYNRLGVYDEKFRVIADFDFISRCYYEGVKFYFLKAVISNMSDGGASNSTNLKVRVADKLYYYEKNNIGIFRTIVNITCYSFKMFIKSFVPQSLIKYFR